MAAYKMAAVKVTPQNHFPLGLIRSHMVVIHLFLMLCDLQGVVRDLRSSLYIAVRYVHCATLHAIAYDMKRNVAVLQEQSGTVQGAVLAQSVLFIMTPSQVFVIKR
jgi:hypothetical protein